MIGSFPDPYPDELFYSVAARYKKRMRYGSIASVARDFFGSSTVPIPIFVQGQLTRLIDNLPPGHLYTIEYLIHHHSMFPFCAPFLTEEQYIETWKIMTRTGRAWQIKSRLNNCLVLGIKRLQYFRFCPLCAREDYDQYGETYWHRMHQIPGINICLSHQVFLENSPISIRDEQARRYATAQSSIDQRKPCSIDYRNKQHIVLLALARDAEWLMKQQEMRFDWEASAHKYIELLTVHGFAERGGSVRYLEALYNAIVEYYTLDFLTDLGLGVPRNDVPNWVRYVIRATPFPYQIQHSLILHFLRDSLRCFHSRPYPHPERVANYRSKWLAIRERYPFVTKVEPHKRYNQVFTWLKRYDNEWLLRNLPPFRVNKMRKMPDISAPRK